MPVFYRSKIAIIALSKLVLPVLSNSPEIYTIFVLHKFEIPIKLVIYLKSIIDGWIIVDAVFKRRCMHTFYNTIIPIDNIKLISYSVESPELMVSVSEVGKGSVVCVLLNP